MPVMDEENEFDREEQDGQEQGSDVLYGLGQDEDELPGE
jgi:hypothetical protein